MLACNWSKLTLSFFDAEIQFIFTFIKTLNSIIRKHRVVHASVSFFLVRRSKIKYFEFFGFYITNLESNIVWASLISITLLDSQKMEEFLDSFPQDIKLIIWKYVVCLYCREREAVDLDFQNVYWYYFQACPHEFFETCCFQLCCKTCAIDYLVKTNKKKVCLCKTKKCCFLSIREEERRERSNWSFIRLSYPENWQDCEYGAGPVELLVDILQKKKSQVAH